MTSAVDPTLVDTLKNTPFPYETLYNPDETLSNGGENPTPVEGGGSGGGDTSSAPQRQIDDTLGDTLEGGSASERLLGNAGPDTIVGGGGGDSIYGLGGTDFLDGEEGNDWLNGNQELDFLFGSEGDDTLIGGQGGDSLDGANGKDLLFGEVANDTLLGGAGENTLYGGKDDDYLQGGDDDDYLSGDRGQDLLYGGAGRDTFVISVNSGGPTRIQADIIIDYVEGEDIIGLSGIEEAGLEFEAGTLEGGQAGVFIRTDDNDNPIYLAFLPSITDNGGGIDFQTF